MGRCQFKGNVSIALLASYCVLSSTAYLLVSLKKRQAKKPYLTMLLINIYLPAMDQRNLEDLELIFQPAHTPLLTQYTCPGPPQASLLSAQHSYMERGREKDVTEMKVIHKSTPYFYKEPCLNTDLFALLYLQEIKLATINGWKLFGNSLKKKRCRIKKKKSHQTQTLSIKSPYRNFLFLHRKAFHIILIFSHKILTKMQTLSQIFFVLLQRWLTIGYWNRYFCCAVHIQYLKLP